MGVNWKKGLAWAVGGPIGGAAYEGYEAAGEASQAQKEAAAHGMSEEARQFDKMVELMQPYVGAGEDALEAQKRLIGLGGTQRQALEIAGIERSPQYQSLIQSGEEALLQNAAATGGLRGGNVQGALAQFRPQILSQLIESQYNKLGGLSGMGQASAAGQASMGQQHAGNIANLWGQYGAADAGGRLGKAQAISGLVDTSLGLGMAAFGGGAGGRGKF